jgi:hypothetical protein
MLAGAGMQILAGNLGSNTYKTIKVGTYVKRGGGCRTEDSKGNVFRIEVARRVVKGKIKRHSEGISKVKSRNIFKRRIKGLIKNSTGWEAKVDGKYWKIISDIGYWKRLIGTEGNMIS